MNPMTTMQPVDESELAAVEGGIVPLVVLAILTVALILASAQPAH
jgi:lactobin A/cerein 7B family class IIb bacteriocin